MSEWRDGLTEEEATALALALESLPLALALCSLDRTALELALDLADREHERVSATMKRMGARIADYACRDGRSNTLALGDAMDNMRSLMTEREAMTERYAPLYRAWDETRPPNDPTRA